MGDGGGGGGGRRYYIFSMVFKALVHCCSFSTTRGAVVSFLWSLQGRYTAVVFPPIGGAATGRGRWGGCYIFSMVSMALVHCCSFSTTRGSCYWSWEMGGGMLYLFYGLYGAGALL